MMNRKHLRVGERLRAVLCALVLLVAVGALLEAKDKGDKDFKAAEAAAAKNDWDKALTLYMSALDKNPNNLAYTIGMRRARFQAGQMHVNKGQKLRTDGKVEDAMAEFQRAIIADPSSSIAIQEMRRTQAMLDDMKGGKKPASPGTANLTPAERQRREDDQKVASIEAPPDLSPVVARIPPIKMNNQPPKVLYETIGKMAGINVVFDSQYTAPQRNSNVDIATNTPIEQAFDYLAMLTHTFWKPISPNTIFVAEDNVTKRRDYEDEVVKVFYVTNVTSVQEFQEIATTIRTVAEIRRVFTYNAQKALIVRGTADQVALTEKLIHDLDKPKSEVVIDVIVMQVNSQYSRSLAATIASGGTAGLQQAISFLPTTTNTGTTTTITDPTTGITTTTSTPTTTGASTTATTNGTIPLSQIGHLSINQFSTSLPGAILNAVMSDARTKTMNKPQVRASDGMKVELIIGQRIPYATGSFSSGVSVSSSVSPLVSTQFNYADVGLKLNITPQIHSTQECTLHIEVEVSEVDQYVNIGGISQPVIGQSKNTADIRLRDGEVNLLSSLSQNSDSSTVGGLPGLTNIPVLGQFLFGSSSKNKTTGELMIALIPHIVRTPDYTAENLRGIYAGSDQVVKLYYAPKADESAAPANPPANAPAANAPAAAPPATVPQVPPGVPQAAPPSNVPVPPVPPGQGSAPAGRASVRFAPEAVDAKQGGTVNVSVQIDNAADLFSASPIRIKYDPALLKLNDATPGELFTRDGVHITSVKDIRNEVGEATVTIARAPGTKGVSGTGSVLMLNFTAIGKGSGTIALPDFNLKNSQLQPVALPPGELRVKVD
ncbi:MAG TPA: cohesin domain-containing protein [Bryobacteraceae bacterium]|jgi:general secretion pathway protein D|nr:cohesin domain-containing protein [Bryobacteraceae bacterium]